MIPTPREFLKEYVESGKLMQLATLRSDGSPELCNVWYDPHFGPDLLRFISRHDRNHSVNICTDGRVAGSIIAIQLEALGQKVRGFKVGPGWKSSLPAMAIWLIEQVLSLFL